MAINYFPTTKPKKDLLFAPLLQVSEEILWVGKPNPTRLFNPSDIFLIPFSLFWMVIVIAFLRTSMWFAIAPHFWIGIYMLFGRFIHQYLARKHTYYAITHERILIVNTLLRVRHRAIFVDKIQTVEYNQREDNTGSIKFDLNADWAKSKNPWYFESQHHLTDIDDVDDVNALLYQLRKSL